MNSALFVQKRKSHMELGEIYFWTATINQWMKLLEGHDYKQVIIKCLEHLSMQNKIEVFAFVIMPNHIHLIWRIKEINGKEKPHIAFLKHTAHQFKKLLFQESVSRLDAYQVSTANKQYEFWQRDSLAVHLYSREVAFQKLDYIHNNPLSERWQLAKSPGEYLHSFNCFAGTRTKA
ncbi:MAG TPA: hypothetical protein VNI52_07230 [Sphingobacteriaceae bacterium]|nr:hypothetical protein [Sphingobacteriaceae bacterium]